MFIKWLLSKCKTCCIYSKKLFILSEKTVKLFGNTTLKVEVVSVKFLWESCLDHKPIYLKNRVDTKVLAEQITFFESFSGCISFSMRLNTFRPTSLLTRVHWFSTYAKFSEKLTFLTSWYAHVPMHIRG